MTREEAYRLAIRACEETWNEKTCKQIKEALEQEPCDVFDEYGNYKYPSDVELTEPNTATSMPCEDVISRQAAIDAAIDGADDWDGGYNPTREEYIKKAINALPSVTPMYTEITLESAIDYLNSIGWLQKHDKELTESAQKQRTGHWIECEDEVKVYCSECKEISDYPTNYCQNCGAKMVEPQESDHKCHTCKHYTSGENDGSCGSYICKGYSNWESEG